MSDNVTRFPDPRTLRLRRASELCAALIASYAGDDRELRRLLPRRGDDPRPVVPFPPAGEPGA